LKLMRGTGLVTFGTHLDEAALRVDVILAG